MTSKNSFFKSMSTKSILTWHLVSGHIWSCNSEKMYKVGNNQKLLFLPKSLITAARKHWNAASPEDCWVKTRFNWNWQLAVRFHRKSLRTGILSQGSICKQKPWVKPGKMEATDDFSNTDVTVRFESYWISNNLTVMLSRFHSWGKADGEYPEADPGTNEYVSVRSSFLGLVQEMTLNKWFPV